MIVVISLMAEVMTVITAIDVIYFVTLPLSVYLKEVKCCELGY